MISNPRITVATVVAHEGKYIIIEEPINGRLLLNQPAGHVEEEEDFPEAARRETLEESGWQVSIDYLIGIYRLRVPGFNFIRFCFAATAERQQSPGPLDSQIEAVHMLDAGELRACQRLRSPLVVRCVEDFEIGKRIELERLQFHDYLGK